MADELRKSGQNQFTVNQIQKKAPDFGLDFGNRQDLYKQLNKLTEYEYLGVNQLYHKGKKLYSVCFDYVRDPSGKIVNIDTPDIKEITTPSQLKIKMATIQNQ